MTESSADRFAVVLDSAERPDYDAMRRATGVIASTAGLTFPDARRIAQTWPGILLRGLEKPQAETVAAELSALGIGLSVVADHELPDIGAAIPVSRLELGPEGFQPNPGASVALDAVRWVDVVVVCAGSVAAWKEHVVRNLSGWTARVDRTCPGVVLEEPKRELRGTRRLLLDLVALSPPRRFRINRDEFSFQCLGERMTLSRSRNFALFVRDLLSSAPAARHNIGAGPARVGHPARRWESFRSLVDFEAHVQWLLYQSQQVVDAQEGVTELPA